LATETLSPRVCWLSGNLKQRQATLAKIKKSYGTCEELKYGDDISVDYLEKQILQSDCFGAKRLFIITAVPSFTSSRATMLTKLKKITEEIPSDSLLIFYGIPASSEKAISAHVGKIGKLIDYDEGIPLVDAEVEVAKLLTEAGKTFEGNVVTLLVRAMPPDANKMLPLDQINLTVDKLLAYLGNRKTVNEEDIHEVSTATEFATIWQLFDAIDDKNFDRALLIKNRLLICESHSNPIEFCNKFIGVASWKYKAMVYVSEARAAGTPDRQIITEAQTLAKLKVEGQVLGMKLTLENPTYTERYMENLINGHFGVTPLDKYSRRRLLSIWDFLSQAVEWMRSMQNPAGYSFLADLFLLIACEKIDDNRKRKLWSYFYHE
jgi:DNA polymerase III delta subunit